jgi:hypothetical protein
MVEIYTISTMVQGEHALVWNWSREANAWRLLKPAAI